VIVHQGEEPDFSLRLLATGRVVRLGRGDPIHHFESPRCDLSRMARYGRRNELLLAFTYFPFPWNAAGDRGVDGQGYPDRRATARDAGDLARSLRGRRGVLAAATRAAARVVRYDRRLRRSGALPLEAVEPHLPAHPRQPVSMPYDAS
jgi:hypothetical protein